MLINLKNLFNEIFNPNFSVFFYFVSILFLLLPVALVTGPFLPDAFLTLIGIYFLIVSIQKKLYAYYKNAFVCFFIIFYLFLIMSGLMSDDIYLSLIESNGPIFYFRYLFFVMGAGVGVAASRDSAGRC